MRILVDGLSSSVGGIGSLIINLTVAIMENKEVNNISFCFFIYDDSEYINILQKNQFEFFVTPKFGKNPIKYYRFIKKHFKLHFYDYLWINNTSKVNYILPYCAKKYGKSKIILHSHGSNTEEVGLKKIIFRLFDILNYKKTQKIANLRFACSEDSADYYYGINNIYRSEVQIIKNGIPINKFKYSFEYRQVHRQELELSDNDIALVLVGRLSEVKNPKFAILLMKQLSDKYKLFLFGEGPLKEELQELIINEEWKNRVYFMGNKRNINEYLSAMDIYLMPSLHEGFPFSIIEAQTSGLPSIVSAGLSKDLNITGYIQYISLEKEEEWISAITNIKRNRREEQINIVRQKGYSIEDSAKKFCQLVREDFCNETEK
ncbi:MAG: glycosyltransferase [Clostridium sp.]|nr:glycosyltransferase [Clostridium sp.]